MSDRLTINDFRRAGLCPAGVRSGFTERGLDFRKFCAEGMPLDEARRHLPDAYLARAIEHAEGRED
jgi:hypothetical protein